MDIELKLYLDEVEEASKRTRKVFLILVFCTLAIFIAFFNSLPIAFNWFESRAEIFRNADKCFYFIGDSVELEDRKLMSKDSVQHIKSLNEFIKINEKQFKSDSMDIKAFISKSTLDFNTKGINFKHPLTISRIDPNLISVDFRKRKQAYAEISNSLKYIKKYSLIHRTTYNAKMHSLNDHEFDKIVFVHVPILGLSFDINNLGIFSGLLISVLYWLLYAALQREHVNTKISFKKGLEEIFEDEKEAKTTRNKNIEALIIPSDSSNSKLHPYDFYEYISMKQVLDIPQKLFKPSRRMGFNSIGKYVLYFPVLVFSCVVFIDAIPTLSTGELTNSRLTWISIVSELILLSISFYAFYIVKEQWKKMSKLWNMQTLLYNLEFILECIGVDNPCDLMEHAENITLSKSNIDDVKQTWYYYWKSLRIKNTNKLTPHTTALKNFINDCLSGRFKSISKDLFNKKEYNKAWNALDIWRKEDGRLNMKDNLEITLLNNVFKVDID